MKITIHKWAAEGSPVECARIIIEYAERKPEFLSVKPPAARMDSEPWEREALFTELNSEIGYLYKVAAENNYSGRDFREAVKLANVVNRLEALFRG